MVGATSDDGYSSFRLGFYSDVLYIESRYAWLPSQTPPVESLTEQPTTSYTKVTFVGQTQTDVTINDF